LSNFIASVIRRIGLGVIIITIITGFYTGWKTGNVISWKYFLDDFALSVALGIWLPGIIGGVLLIGFSEVIELLENIKKEVENISYR
jgi:hypothetical protein